MRSETLFAIIMFPTMFATFGAVLELISVVPHQSGSSVVFAIVGSIVGLIWRVVNLENELESLEAKK